MRCGGARELVLLEMKVDLRRDWENPTLMEAAEEEVELTKAQQQPELSLEEGQCC